MCSGRLLGSHFYTGDVTAQIRRPRPPLNEIPRENEGNSNALFDSWPIELNRTKLSIQVAPRDRKIKGDCLFLT